MAEYNECEIPFTKPTQFSALGVRKVYFYASDYAIQLKGIKFTKSSSIITGRNPFKKGIYFREYFRWKCHRLRLRYGWWDGRAFLRWYQLKIKLKWKKRGFWRDWWVRSKILCGRWSLFGREIIRYRSRISNSGKKDSSRRKETLFGRSDKIVRIEMFIHKYIDS